MKIMFYYFLDIKTLIYNELTNTYTDNGFIR